MSDKIKNPYEEYLGIDSDDEKRMDYVKSFKDPLKHEEFQYRECKWLEGKIDDKERN